MLAEAGVSNWQLAISNLPKTAIQSLAIRDPGFKRPSGTLWLTPSLRADNTEITKRGAVAI